MKTMIAVTVAVLAMTSISNAGSVREEKPCGSKCKPVPEAVSREFRRSNGVFHYVPDYDLRSRTIIRSPYGTTVVDSYYWY